MSDEDSNVMIVPIDPEVCDAPHLPVIIDVISEDPSPGPNKRLRRVVRRESRPLDQDERREIDDQIIESNHELKRLEIEKAAAVKKYNREIADHRQAIDDAIDVLRKDSIEVDVVRIEVYDYEESVVRYYDLADVTFQDCVDERDMDEDEKQTTIAM